MREAKELLAEIRESKEDAFWWLGQLGYALKLDGKTIYIDPFLADHPSRTVPAPFLPEELTEADYILGTHYHTDHIHLETWKRIAAVNTNVKFILPDALLDLPEFQEALPLDRCIGLDDETSFTEDGITFTGIAAAHEFLDTNDFGQNMYLGYVICGSRHSIYHSGDCCIYEGLRSKLMTYSPLDAMFIPINGRDAERYNRNCIGCMTFQEAVDLAGDLKPALAVPGHYEMFPGNQEDPQKFADYLEAKFPGQKYWIGEHCTKVLLP